MKTSYKILTITAIVGLAFIAISAINHKAERKHSGSEQYTMVSLVNKDHDTDAMIRKTKQVPEKSEREEAIEIASEDQDLSYLKFDVMDYTATNPEITELPEPETSYLRFDIEEQMMLNPVDMNELPETEYDYLRFDVSKYSTPAISDEIGELPEAE